MKEGLTHYLTPFNIWALAFGCIVGWGSFIMPSTTFLPLAGPLGTVIAISLSAAIMLIIAANYHYMLNHFADSGGAFTYAKKILGYDHALFCAWFLWLAYIALIWANATAFVIIGKNLFGEVFKFGFHYTIFNYEIYFGEVAFTLLILACFGLFCARKKIFAKSLNTLLVIFFLSIGLTCVVAAFENSSSFETFSPSFGRGDSPVRQIFGIVALAPWAFAGFESITHLAGEFKFPAKRAFKIMATAIITAAIFYISMTYLALFSISEEFFNWQEYVENLSDLKNVGAIPIFNAIQELFGKSGKTILGLMALATLSTSLIGYYFAVSRLTYALAADDLLPRCFAKLSADGSPINIIFGVTVISAFIPFLGQTVIGWVTDITSAGASIAYGYTSLCAYLTARNEGSAKFKITGILGVIFAAMFLIFLLVPSLGVSSILATESYFALSIWSVFGFVFFQKVFDRDENRRLGKSVLVWIVMLFFIFFGSLMWVRQETDDTMKIVVKNTGEFYQNELESYGVKNHSLSRLQEEYYLKSQMDTIRDSLFKNSLIQMGFILLSLFIMFYIYSAIVRRGQKAELEKIQAQESSRAKTVFLSNMSHDIRTPMNAIIGYTNLARRHGVSQAEVQDFLLKIENSSKHLLALINDVLEMSRIESGKMELDAAPANIKTVLDELRDMFANQMHGKKIDFTVDSSGVKNAYVSCDKHRLNRVLLNLTSNAYKFTPEGGKISITLTEKNCVDNRALFELRVKDSGIGMSPEFAKTVFEPFTRERTSTVSGIQGTGLGMAITKSIVDLMRGDISVETAPGKGTEFILHIELPLVDKSEVPEEIPAVAQAQDTDFTDKKLLLVEDIEVNREIALMILDEFGFKVDYAVNGKEAVEKVAASKPGDFDAILMDIQMPIMNGYEAARAIRQLENPALANIPIIAMTANAFSEDVERAKAAGMNDHVAKPLDVPKMIEALQRILAKG